MAAFAADPEAQWLHSTPIREAISQLQERVKSNPNDAIALNLLARAYYSLEQWDDAITTNQRALKVQPNSSDFHEWMGRAYGEKAENVGMIGAASLARKTKAEFEKAVQLNPVSTQARLDLSEYLIEAPGFMGGSIDKARAQADATERFDVAASHLIRARIAQQKKDYDEAELEFKAAIATSKSPANYWINLASFYQSRGRLPEMEKAISTAVSFPNKQGCVLYDAARILNNSGRNLPGALQYLRQYLAEGRFDEDAPAFHAHYLMGQILEKMKRRPEAAQEYRAALQLANDFKKAQDALGKLQG
jgi:tetratricopeptide (TPR) repeat protein